MKKVNDMTVFEPTDKCSLDEYSGEIAKEVPELIKKAKEEIKQKVIEISENDIKQDTEIATLKNNYTNLQEQNTKLEEKIKKDRENMINLETEGQSIHIENSSDLEGQLEVLGNMEQETSTQGKNKLNLRQANYTVAGVNVTKNYSKLTLNGTLNTSNNILDTVGDMDRFIYLGKFKMGTYRFSKFIISGKYTIDKNIGIGTYACYIRKKDKTILAEIGGSASGGTGVTITLQEDTDLYMQIFCNAGAVFENYVLGFQLEEGDKTTDFEQFIPDMSSPEYPSEIRAVGDNINLLENTTKTQTVNGVTFTVNEDGTVMANGTATNVSYIDVNTFPFVKDIDYILSGCPNGGTDNSYKIYCINVASGAGLTNDYGKGGAIKVGTNQTGTIRIRIASGYKADNLIFKPKLEKGTVATSYSPYGQGSVGIKKQNKNLMPINTEFYELTSNGIKNKSNSVTNKITEFKIKKGQKVEIALKLKTKTSTSTSFTFRTNGVRNAELGFININDYNLNQIYKKTYIATEDTVIDCALWGNEKKEIFEFQFWAEINNITEYTEHQEETKILPIQKPMLEGDDFIKEVDGWKEVHDWGEVILEGKEDWFLGISKKNYTDFFATDTLIKNTAIVINNNDTNVKNYVKSNYFLTDTTPNKQWKDDATNSLTINASRNTNININNNIAKTVEELKLWLSKLYETGNPVEICYKLETPTKLPCTPEQTEVLDELDNFQTYKPVTNITTDSIAKLKLKYIADTKTYVDNKYNGLAQQILNLAGGNNNV